jgi:hypothetical protein
MKEIDSYVVKIGVDKLHNAYIQNRAKCIKIDNEFSKCQSMEELYDSDTMPELEPDLDIVDLIE